MRGPVRRERASEATGAAQRKFPVLFRRRREEKFSESLVGSAAGTVASLLEPIRGKRILLVDDEPWIVKLVAEILTAAGHEIDTAANGLVALRQIQERSYDLIICDVRMPELDGPGLYQRLAQRQPALLQRVVFITGSAHDAVTTAFLRQTGAPCLEKPFTVGELHEVTQRMLRSV